MVGDSVAYARLAAKSALYSSRVRAKEESLTKAPINVVVGCTRETVLAAGWMPVWILHRHVRPYVAATFVDRC